MFRDKGYGIIKKFEMGGHGRTHTGSHASRPIDLRTQKFSDGGEIKVYDTIGQEVSWDVIKNNPNKNYFVERTVNGTKVAHNLYWNGKEFSMKENGVFKKLPAEVVNDANFKKTFKTGSYKNQPPKTGKVYSKLFNDVKMDDLEEYLPEARTLTGIEDFNPLNAAHTLKLQEALIARSEEFDSTFFSGKETDILEGDLGVNKQGTDGKFGIDTFNALKEFSEKTPGEEVKEKIKTVVQKGKEIIQDHGYNALTLLKAGTGIHGIGKALKNIEIGETPELSASFRGFMNRAKELSESGIDPVEKARMQSDLGTAYNAGVKNAMRAAGGSRGSFLANAGVLNANRVNGLLKLAALDNEAARANMKNYGDNLRFQEKYLAENKNKTRDMKYEEDVRQANVWGQLGSGLLGMAFEDFSYAQEQQNMKPYYDALVNKSDMTLFEHQAKIDNQSLGITNQ
tara:strand:- start:4431 stop:5792 length:1362 start_codon:yes stop_codon:yes gene_type:complete